MATDRALPDLGTIEHTTRRERTLTRLREALATGELPPGTHLAEVELSESLAVSRGTLREALRHLQQEGLIVADGRGRLRVRAVGAKDVREIFAVRAALESLAAELLCVAADRSEMVADLRAALAAMHQEGPVSARVERDLEFHEQLCRAAGNAVLLESWLRVRGLARASITVAGLATATRNMDPNRHRPIVDAVERGDAAEARAIITTHLAEAAEQIVAHLPQSDAPRPPRQ